MIAAVFCFSIKSSSSSDSNLNNSSGVGYNLIALLIGMLAPCLMSTKHVIIRMFKGNYDPISQAIDGILIESFLYSIIAFFLLQDPNFDFTF